MQLFKSRKKNVCSEIWHQLTASDSSRFQPIPRTGGEVSSQKGIPDKAVTPGLDVQLASCKVLVFFYRMEGVSR